MSFMRLEEKSLERANLVLRDPSGEPFDHFGTIDIMGPLPTMQDDNKYVMLYKIKQR